MATQWTAEQVLDLAANANARKNAKGLAKAGNWLSLHSDGRAVWGEIKGSGKSPYQTRIDLTEPAFKCDCTSRQHPCKHSIGLFLLYVEDNNAFSAAKPPQWVTSWIASRDSRAAKKNEAKPAVVDTAAQAKRAAQREEKVRNGMAELDLWLRDVIRNGLASLQAQRYDFYDQVAARMIDAQAKGVASQIRDLSAVPFTGNNWPERMLERLSKLYLLSEGYRNLDQLSPETRADVRAIVGWSYNKDDLLQLPAVHDAWLVIGRRVEQEDWLNTQRIWLWSLTRQQPALYLEFVFGQYGGASFEVVLPTGSFIDASVAYYPSNYPLRVIFKQRQALPEKPESFPAQTLTEAFDAYSTALARQPWLNLFPMLLRDMIPAWLDDRFVLRDLDGRVLPVSHHFNAGWNLMSISGGYPITISGEWDGDEFVPLGAWAENRQFAF